MDSLRTHRPFMYSSGFRQSGRDGCTRRKFFSFSRAKEHDPEIQNEMMDANPKTKHKAIVHGFACFFLTSIDDRMSRFSGFVLLFSGEQNVSYFHLTILEGVLPKQKNDRGNNNQDRFLFEYPEL